MLGGVFRGELGNHTKPLLYGSAFFDDSKFDKS